MNTDIISIERLAGYRVEYTHDAYAESPREWDNLGSLALVHSRYSLVNESGLSLEPGGKWGQIYRQLEEGGASHIVPVWMTDHSGLTLHYGGGGYDRWDSGQVGYSYLAEGSAEAMGTPEDLIEVSLAAELAEYGEWLNGETYGIAVYAPSAHACTSCGHIAGVPLGEEWSIIGWQAAEAYAAELVAGLTRLAS